MVVLLLLLQIWVFRDCGARGLRTGTALPRDRRALLSAAAAAAAADKKRKEGLLPHDEYFEYHTGTRPRFRSDDGFEDGKRKVPSCPDPLHN